jgi:hypothetical protein
VSTTSQQVCRRRRRIPLANPVSYAPTYFPGTGNIADAQRLTLTLGTEQSGINFVLQPVRAVRVSGTVVDSNGAPTQALLNLTPAGFGDDGGLQLGNPARVLPGRLVHDSQRRAR